MSRKKNQKEQYRVGKRLHTDSFESLVILTWVDIARNLEIEPYILIEKIVEKQDETGLQLEHISARNEAGQRIHVTERKYLSPGKTHERVPEKLYGRIDDYVQREYSFMLVQNGMKKYSFTAADVSDRALDQMKAILSQYKSGLRSASKKFN